MMSLIWNIRALMRLAALAALLLASAAADASMIEFTFDIQLKNCPSCATYPVSFSYELPTYPGLVDTHALAPPITVDAGAGYSATFVRVSEFTSGARLWFFYGDPSSTSYLGLMAMPFPGYSPGQISIIVLGGSTDSKGPGDYLTFNGTGGTLTIEEVNTGSPVLEPTTMALLLTGLAGAAGARLRRRLK